MEQKVKAEFSVLELRRYLRGIEKGMAEIRKYGVVDIPLEINNGYDECQEMLAGIDSVKQICGRGIILEGNEFHTIAMMLDWINAQAPNQCQS